jgi:hypothetical protein
LAGFAGFQRRLTPVIFPPGRARLFTIPVPSGSDAGAITIGVVLVTFFAARIGPVA